MKIQVSSTASSSSGPVTVLFVPRGERPAVPASVTGKEFEGKRLQTLRIHDGNRLLVGLGEGESIDDAVWRDAAATAISKLRDADVRSATLDLRKFPEAVAPCVEGAVLANFRFEDFLAEKTHAVEKLTVHCEKREIVKSRKAATEAETLAAAVNLARKLNSQPGNVLYPEILAAEARKIARSRKLKVTVLDKAALVRRGFGGILAVGQGSARPPRFIIIEYPGTGAKKRPVALVGKAITFDTGGISIKTAKGMEEMIYDKSGGTTVLGAMVALADLEFPDPVVGLIAAAENMPGGSAYRPGDIITMYDGTTVEIVNTDAEGRLVLADAIAYARKDERATAIINLATLTGACGVALGPYIAGLWSNDDSIRDSVLNGGRDAGEPLWHMPLGDEFDEDLKSHTADLKNCGGRLGGACTAAAFLHRFAGDTPWVHLDIAFPSALTRSRHGLPRGATGFGVRTLVAALRRMK